MGGRRHLRGRAEAVVRKLKGGKPRRFKDHRRREARPYLNAYDAIAERYPPPDRLGRRLVSIGADLLLAYDTLAQARQTPRVRSARRKTVGLILGMLREVAGGAKDAQNDHGLSSLDNHLAGRAAAQQAQRG